MAQMKVKYLQRRKVVSVKEWLDRQHVSGYDALARALLANDRANPARALMAELH